VFQRKYVVSKEINILCRVEFLRGTDIILRQSGVTTACDHVCTLLVAYHIWRNYIYKTWTGRQPWLRVIFQLCPYCSRRRTLDMFLNCSESRHLARSKDFIGYVICKEYCISLSITELRTSWRVTRHALGDLNKCLML